MALPTNNPGQSNLPDMTTPAPQVPPQQTSVPAAQPEPQVDWQKEAESFQKRFNGLQSTYQKERMAWQADSAKLFDLGKQYEELLGQHAAVETTTKTLQEQLDTKATEAEVAAANYNRMRYVAEKHPDLLAFELKGLLPDGAAGDELEKTLADFKATIAGIVKTVGTAGAPPPPSAQPTQSPDDLMKRYNELQFSGKYAEAEQVLNEYFKASHK